MGATQSTDHPFVLETPRQGSLRGIEQRDKTGKPVLRRFLKIPYAQPPVGRLRWRRPQPLPAGWTFDRDGGVPGDYTEFGPICPQPEYNMGAALVDNPNAAPGPDNVQSEDCLYLNMWVPAGTPPETGWPVQFFLHGGWLQIGNAMQSPDYDPWSLLAHSTPRIIVSPTYRLNIFGFAAGAHLDAAIPDSFAGNFGLWDQRLALEWTYANVSLFGGNSDLITVGGLSAGSHSAFLQLFHDTYLPTSKRIIKQVHLYSNAIAVQPNPATSSTLTSQFDSVCTALSIPTSLRPDEKLSQLRSQSWESLVAAIPKLTHHTFRSSTDGPISAGGFIPPTLLTSIHDGSFATLLARHDVRVLLGEVRDEALLYRLINPPSDRAGLTTQVSNYYPRSVADALIAHPVYGIPPPDSDNDQTIPADQWADWFATIVADGQVHASSRWLVKCLRDPPTSTSSSEIASLPAANVFRYRICWRAKGLDLWLKPEVGCCHASDTPVWWASGFRADFNADDRRKCLKWLDPFGKFLEGRPTEEIGWGDGADMDRVRLLNEEGEVIESYKDEGWERGLQICQAVWEAQKDGLEKIVSRL